MSFHGNAPHRSMMMMMMGPLGKRQIYAKLFD